ncbi:MAG: NUDIX hydrolase [Acidimicrobiales bacterium]
MSDPSDPTPPTAPTDFDPLAVPISPAATVMVVEDRAPQTGDPAGLQVLMLRRTARAVFAGDMWVYPGGRVDASDEEIAALHVTGLSAAEANRRLGVDRGGLAYWVAALRECFEEAGILLARGLADGAAIDLGDPLRQQRLAGYRDQLNAGQMSFGEVIAAEEVVLDAARIHYVAHWVTPLGSPRRFDTRFFLAAAPPGQIAAHDDTEVVHHEWVDPATALQRWQADQMAMMSPTARMLMCLTPFPRATEAVAAAALDLEPEQIRVRREGAAYHIMLPGDPGWEQGDPDTEFGWIKLRPPIR